ncbi:hypothetical protein E1263_09640 [Kribbella antibiotica]|uniref:Uncharacterized protein n=1 Tax=Kribbella antibiotica TaxID=190195 RepID=A0A4V2YQ77_9ACTN|nr:hypothetical protein [Kribbella antibiotica]TDD60867.1 hypothetical protein E1263_09640 [Kribbella antibiotica]
MSKDLHIFTGGIDPFVFQVNNVVVHVHTGMPPAVGLKSSGDPAVHTGLDPAVYAPLEPADYAALPPVLGVQVMDPDSGKLLKKIDGSWSAEKVTKVIARTHSHDHPSLSQLDSVLDGLSTAENDDATVYVFQLDE